MQQLGKYKLFGEEFSDVFWVSKIDLSKERVECIKDSFENQEVHFSYPQDVDDFNYLIYANKADNGEKQTCYFNLNKSDTQFNSFTAERVKNTSDESIKFSIVNVKSDFVLFNKSLDIDLKESLTSNRGHKAELQQISRRDISNGKLYKR